MQTAATDVLVGRTLEGRYRILDRIARGGMSTVYAAVDERLDRMVAVKVMSSALSADPAFSDRFAREARAAARLTHLNAVSVYDQGQEVAQDGHHVFLVMELVTGRTLRELIHDRGRLTTAEAVSIMEPVLSALSAAHRAGLVHRDVKPENILLSDDGVVKVADFGLAHAVETDPSSTRTGLMMGTVAYCAPEQLVRGETDPRSDVYSAGIVLFELLTGTTPYSGETAMNIAYQHVHSRVPAPSSRIRPDDGIPSEIDEIVIAATDSDPSGRPNDAGALLAELADVRVELGLPIAPVPPRNRERQRRDEQRAEQRARARAGQHDTVLVAGPGGGSTSRLDEPGRHTTARHGADRPRAQRGDDPPPPVVIRPPSEGAARKRRRRRTLIGLLVVLAVGLGAFFGGKAFIDWRFAHVPDIGGATVARATSALQQAGYDVRVNEGKVFSDTVALNHVVSADPKPGSTLATGHTVTLTLSLGKQTYVVPQTRGRSVAAATAALNAVGLSVVPTPRQQYDDKVDEGTVIGTVPAGAVRVAHDQPITIVVSRGPPSVDVPTIETGSSATEAEQKLEDADLRVRRIEQYSDAFAEGTVISVSPSGRATKFSTVTLTVSRGPQMVSVPNVVNKSVADAEAAIRAANLVPDVRKTFSLIPRNKISSQSPASGKVRVGSTVTLFRPGI